MELDAKAQIFALFAIPAILSIGAAEGIKELSVPVKLFLYGYGTIAALCSIFLPWVS